MIDTDKHDWDNQTCAYEVPYWMRHMYDDALMIIAQKEAEVKRLREGIKAYLNLEIETHELKEMIE